MTVRSLLQHKRSLDVCTIDPKATVFEAIKVLAERNLGALIVVEKGRLVGLMTERDYARKVILKGHSSKDTTVASIMNRNIIYVTPEAMVEDCMAIMTERYIRHLPVVDHGVLIGIISSGDVIKSVLGEKEFVIQELINYITDSPMMVMEQAQRVV